MDRVAPGGLLAAVTSAVAVAAGGCYDPAPLEGAPCSDRGECPRGLACDETGRCTRAPADALGEVVFED